MAIPITTPIAAPVTKPIVHSITVLILMSSLVTVYKIHCNTNVIHVQVLYAIKKVTVTKRLEKGGTFPGFRISCAFQKMVLDHIYPQVENCHSRRRNRGIQRVYFCGI